MRRNTTHVRLRPVVVDLDVLEVGVILEGRVVPVEILGESA